MTVHMNSSNLIVLFYCDFLFVVIIVGGGGGGARNPMFKCIDPILVYCSCNWCVCVQFYICMYVEVLKIEAKSWKDFVQL